VLKPKRKETPMRQSLLDQLPLVPVSIDHDHARELGAVSALLDQLHRHAVGAQPMMRKQ
jgi:hypothetical protein